MSSGFKLRGLAAALVAATAVAGTSARADVLDFEALPPSLFFGGESFAVGDYTFTVNGDFGVVDTSASCAGSVCPTGNPTQYYQSLNDGHVSLARSDGEAFDLTGLAAGFLAADPLQTSGVPGQLRATATLASGGTLEAAWTFAAGEAGAFPFSTYLAALSSVVSIDFYACTYDGSGQCLSPADNPGLFGPAQFGLDNLVVSASSVVPEPGSAALLALGVAGLAAFSRRRRGTPPSH